MYNQLMKCRFYPFLCPDPDAAARSWRVWYASFPHLYMLGVDHWNILIDREL